MQYRLTEPAAVRQAERVRLLSADLHLTLLGEGHGAGCLSACAVRQMEGVRSRHQLDRLARAELRGVAVSVGGIQRVVRHAPAVERLHRQRRSDFAAVQDFLFVTLHRVRQILLQHHGVLASAEQRDFCRLIRLLRRGVVFHAVSGGVVGGHGLDQAAEGREGVRLHIVLDECKEGDFLCRLIQRKAAFVVHAAVVARHTLNFRHKTGVQTLEVIAAVF